MTTSEGKAFADRIGCLFVGVSLAFPTSHSTFARDVLTLSRSRSTEASAKTRIGVREAFEELVTSVSRALGPSHI